ncbi:MAG: hypothetical protein NTX03_05785, partial [Bacteroidetes bacterium]|nr:hypothetical protein [Bacteroidota bacterium]
GVSFIQIAGLLDTDITDQWKHTLLLPHILMKKEKRVSLLKIFMHNRWAKEGEEMTTLDIFDPGLMHKWVKEKDDESSVTSGKSEGVQYHYTAEY